MVATEVNVGCFFFFPHFSSTWLFGHHADLKLVVWWLDGYHTHTAVRWKLCPVLSNWENLWEITKKINLISIKLPTTAISILQPDFDTLKAKMRLMQSVKHKCGRLWDYVNIILKRNLEKRMFHGEPNLTFKFQGLERGTAP